jgi:hypothetical protein
MPPLDFLAEPAPLPVFITFHMSAAALPISVAWVVAALKFSLAMRPASVAALSVPELAAWAAA